MSWWIVAAAVLAVVGLGVVLWLFARRHRTAPLGEGEAIEATATIPGFVARKALVGDDRRAALVVGGHGRVALVAGGRPPQAREIRWQDIRSVAGGLRVEAGRRAVTLPGLDVLDVRRAGDDGWRRQAGATNLTTTPEASRVTRAGTP